jgi:hypothetical protein
MSAAAEICQTLIDDKQIFEMRFAAERRRSRRRLGEK